MSAIIHFLTTTRVDILLTLGLYYFGWFPIFAVLTWGLIQVWQDIKQGDYVRHLKWYTLKIDVPPESVQTPKGMENFFQNLAGSKSSLTWKEIWLIGKIQAWFSLELVSDGGQVSFYIRTQEKYLDLVEAAFYAQYPDAHIMQVDDYTDELRPDYPNDETDLWGSEMLLAKDNYYPIRTWEMFEHQGEKEGKFKDPMLSTIEILGKMKPEEKFMIQILIQQPNEQDWAKKGVEAINKIYGKEEHKKKSGILDSIMWLPAGVMEELFGLKFGKEEEHKKDDFVMFKITPEEKSKMEAIEEKVSKIGWRAKIRIVYIAPKAIYRKGTIAAMAKGIFHQFAHLQWNKFGLHDPSTPKDDYIWQEWVMPRKQRRLLARYKHRKLPAGSTPYILNSEELATIFHFPAAGARTPVLTRPGAKLAEPPLNLTLGMNEEALPNFSFKASETKKPVSKPEPMQMPHPGMPAPLPPGIDAAETLYDPTPDAPGNLPM